MVAFEGDVFESRSWHHEHYHVVKVGSVVSVEECNLENGEVVGYNCILSASRMNSAAVLFLKAVEKVEKLIKKV